MNVGHSPTHDPPHEAPVYVETSVISYLTSRPSENLRNAAGQLSRRLCWELRGSEFDPFISRLVLDEESHSARSGSFDKPRVTAESVCRRASYRRVVGGDRRYFADMEFQTYR